MDQTYPPGPENVAADLTAPGVAYKRRARIALASLLLFIAIYFSLTCWFGWTAWKYFDNALAAGGGSAALIGFGLAAAAAFLTVFLVKALFFIDRGGEISDIEVTAADEPGLFDFLNRLADEAGAPRPHRVFLSPRVNAAVFYDLTLLNLLIPSKKNLEIGLPLVNGLNLGELKAVLAHEFGHFRQGSMAVGRWVYVAQQVATHIIHQRDILDRFLLGLSRIDIRIAWIGWILRLIVWALRAILDSVFSLVVLAQRSLSREMEFNADLVSVSLCGSDALIHALHRLHAADDAWNRALGTAQDELSAGRSVADIFVVQKVITQRMKDILDDEHYDTPPTSDSDPESHRIFATEDVHPPQMWSTHPPNSAREENAKKQYVAAAVDERPAWSVFANPQKIREDMTTHIFSGVTENTQLDRTAMTETVGNVNKAFSRASYDRRYRGTYMGRRACRSFAAVDDMFDGSQEMVGGFDDIYPPELADQLEHWRNLDEEQANLQALYDGKLTSPDGVLRHRGNIMKRRDLPAAIEEVVAERDIARQQITDHDRLVRNVHRAAAIKLGKGWQDYHYGLTGLLHYAEHSEANLSDAHGRLANVWSIAIADGKVSSSEMKLILDAARDLHGVLAGVDAQKSDVSVGEEVANAMGVSDWTSALGEDYTLPGPDKDNIGDWLGVVDGWVGQMRAALTSLRNEALETLLLAEDQIRNFASASAEYAAAPSPARIPNDYATLLPNAERKLQTRLGLWDRFQTADGFFPGITRFSVATAIVGSLLGFGFYTSGSTSVNVYNGLVTSIVVIADDTSVTVSPSSTATFSPPSSGELHLRTLDSNGALIEELTVDASNSLAEYVYNVAKAAPMIEWTAVYGTTAERDPDYLGASHWFSTRADYIFSDPPESINTSGSGGAKTVLGGFEQIDPRYVAEYMPDGADVAAVASAHARWDHPDAVNTFTWLAVAADQENFSKIIEDRLQRDENEVLALRFEQDTAEDDEAAAAVCKRHKDRSKSEPQNADWRYLAIRCIDDDIEQSEAFIAAYQLAPDHAWLAGGAGSSYAELAQWDQADAALSKFYADLPGVRRALADTVLRVRREQHGVSSADGSDLVEYSDWLQMNLQIESEKAPDDPSLRSFWLLANGRLEDAVGAAEADGAYGAEILRLAAASDGASDELVKAAMKLQSTDGIDQNTLPAALGLSLRLGSPKEDLLQQIDEYFGDEGDFARNFITAMSDRSTAAASVDKLLHGATPATRGRIYTMGAIALGSKAPSAWRDSARRLLFASERPYFE